MRQWQELLPALRDERGIFGVWHELVLAHSVLGKQTHDARLVAAAIRHGLTHVLTFNAADFHRYQKIQVLDPQTVGARLD